MRASRIVQKSKRVESQLRTGVDGDGAVCIHSSCEFAATDFDPEERDRRVKISSSSVARMGEVATHVAPVHFPLDFLPFTMSQYDPFGREVVNVAFQALAALLIAT